MHDLRDAVAFYERMLDEHADDGGKVGWRISYSQLVNFLSMTRIAGLRDGVRVLDVGCGLGALKGYFDRVGLQVEYTGYDVSARMVEAARQRYPDARFEVRDILRDPPDERFDLVFCSGALSFRVADQIGYIVSMLQAMFGLCDIGVAFTMLSAWSYADSPALQRDALVADYEWPSEMFRLCKTLSRHVALLHDTQRHAFTMLVYRSNRGALRRYLEVARPGTSYGPEVQAAIDYHLELGLFAELREFLGGLEPDPRLWRYAGRALEGLGDQPGAAEAYNKAIDANPDDALPRLDLGGLIARSGNVIRAIDHFRRAVELAPSLPDAHEQLVSALLLANRGPEAREAAAGAPEGAIRDYLQGLAAIDPDEALAAFERALVAAPNYLAALARAAFLYEQKQDWDTAIALWRRAERLSPTDMTIKERIGRAVRAAASR